MSFFSLFMDPDNFKNKKIGKFILKEKIGEGAFSYVYLAEESPKKESLTEVNKQNDKKA